MTKISEDTQQLLKDVDLYRIPVNPIEICEKLDIVYQENPYQGFDGTLIIAPNNNQLIGVNSNITEESRRKFTCAHELGHYQYDVTPDKKIFNCSRDDTGYGHQLSQQIEIRANAFAAELLMPQEFFLPAIRNKQPSWQLILELCNKFETSLQATATRFVTLAHHTCWLVIAKNGKLQRYVKSDYNEFSINLNNTFKYSINLKSNDWITTLAVNWFHDTYRIRDKEILSWTLSENQYGETLILLWDKYNSLLNDEIFKEEHKDFYGSGQWN